MQPRPAFLSRKTAKSCKAGGAQIIPGGASSLRDSLKRALLFPERGGSRQFVLRFHKLAHEMDISLGELGKETREKLETSRIAKDKSRPAEAPACIDHSTI